MPITKINNTKLLYHHYDDFGHDNNLVFSNSLGTDYTMWEPQMDILSHHFNILRYDTRGHGKSQISSKPISIADLGNDVIALLDELKLEQVCFCGLSMGGLIGQWLGIYHPKRFEKIIIANTAAKIGTEQGWNDRIEQVTKNGLESILEGTAQRWFTPKFRKGNPQVISNILEKFAQNDVKGYAACCAAVRDADFREWLYDLEVPTLIISGSKDEVTTIKDSKFMAKKIPVASHVTLNAAHLSNVEQAEEFSKHIIHFAQH